MSEIHGAVNVFMGQHLVKYYPSGRKITCIEKSVMKKERIRADTGIFPHNIL